MLFEPEEIRISKYKPTKIPCCAALKSAMTEGKIQYRYLHDGNVYFVVDAILQNHSVNKFIYVKYTNAVDRVEAQQGPKEEEKEEDKMEYIQAYKVKPLTFSYCPFCGSRLNIPEWQSDTIVVDYKQLKNVIGPLRVTKWKIIGDMRKSLFYLKKELKNFEKQKKELEKQEEGQQQS